MGINDAGSGTDEDYDEQSQHIPKGKRTGKREKGKGTAVRSKSLREGGQDKRHTITTERRKIARDINSDLPPLLQLPSTNTALISSRATSTHASVNGAPTHLIETVIFSGFEIQAWYASPYPIEEESTNSASTIASTSALPSSNLNPASIRTTISGKTGTSISPERGTISSDSKNLQEKEKEKKTKRLYVCDGCFKYTLNSAASSAHKKSCKITSPPGIKVYERGDHAIWEVDGVTDKLYCQNLCLFGKMFIDHKYVFFDVEGFKFYVLTKGLPSFDYVIGFFSKEKISYDDYNLACIMTFPPYQKQGYGTLLIEFSYELSRRTPSRLAGTPERPLSELGLKGYLNYWTFTLVRYFLAVFAAQGEPSNPSTPSDPPINTETVLAKRRNSGGTIGSVQSKRARLSLSHNNGNKNAVDEKFEFPTSLEMVAEATFLRPDDIAFTLVECGLAQWRRKVKSREINYQETQEDDEGEDVDRGDALREVRGEIEEIVITLEKIQAVAKERRIRDLPWLDRSFVLL